MIRLSVGPRAGGVGKPRASGDDPRICNAMADSVA